MSAAHAHAPSDHPTAPSAAPSAAPAAANNAMHFKHGGVLGLTESIARLVKGVTYDAAMDTFAHPANNPNMGAAHPTDGAHPAPHPAPHPTPAADGAHPAPHPAPHPTPAADGAHPAPHPAAGHEDDDDDSISGSIIKGLSHMGHYGMAFPILAQGLKWAKNKMFPEIHEIPTEDQHVGDQILHKLKKNKKNKTELDHHALEGFCKGLDIANLNRTFRMFTDPARFALAVDREPGREEIKKEIANILDLSGDVDLKEVEDQTNRLLHLLGHHVDSRVEPQRKHLVDIINNVKAWLTKDTLKDIYEPKAKEGNFKIDFEHFGDMLLEEVTPENRDRYLRSIKPSTFQATFKAKFPYLTNEGALKIALKKEPEREKVLAQLRQFTGVDYAMDLAALTAHKNILLERLGVKPKDAISESPAVPATGTKPAIAAIEAKPKEALFDEYVAFETVVTLVETTMKNTGALEDLFEGKTEVKEEEYKVDYKNIGDGVLKIKEKTLVPFLRSVRKDGWDDMENEIGDLLTADKVKEEAGDNPDKLREQIQNLFSLKGKVSVANLTARVAQIKKRLEATNDWVDQPDITDDTKIIKIDPERAALKKSADHFIAHILEEALKNLTTANPEVLSKLWPVAEDVKSKFEWTKERYKNFGASIFDEVNDKNRMATLRNFNADELTRAFKHLYPVNPASLKTTEGRKKLRNQLKALLNLEEPFERDDILREADAIKKMLTGTPAPADGTKEADSLNTLSKLLDGLTATAKPEVPETSTTPLVAAVGAGPFPDNESVEALFADVLPVSPEDFVANFRTLADKSEIRAFIRGYSSRNFHGHFPYLVSAEELDDLIDTGTPEDLKLAKKQAISFVGRDAARVNVSQVSATVADFRRVLSSVESSLSDEDKTYLGEIRKDLAAIELCLKEKRLDMLFDRDNPNRNFSYYLDMVSDSQSFLALLSKLNKVELWKSFLLMRMPLRLNMLDPGKESDKKTINEAKKQLRYLLGLDTDGKLEPEKIKTRAQEIIQILSEKYFKIPKGLQNASPSAYENAVTLVDTLNALVKGVDEGYLKVILGEAEKTT